MASGRPSIRMLIVVLEGNELPAVDNPVLSPAIDLARSQESDILFLCPNGEFDLESEE